MSENVSPKCYSIQELLKSHKKDLTSYTELTDAGNPAAAICVLKIAYLGTNYAGLAAQREDIPTVAGELERALSTLFAREITLVVCGRTDAGVHAQAQFVSFAIDDTELERNPQRIISGLNALLPDDIAIRGIYLAPLWFSARQSAIERSYIYRICDGFSRPIANKGRAYWRRSVTPLSLDAMQKAANLMVGEHDFASFCKSSSKKLMDEVEASTLRFVRTIDVYTAREGSEDLICIHVVGNAFLHNMVRIIAGTLIEVGEGRRSVESISDLFETPDRRLAGKTAPALGLTFEDVLYPEGALSTWESYVGGLVS